MIWTLAALGLGVCAPASAAESGLIEEEIVVEASALAQRVGGAASVTVLDRDALELLRPSHPQEAFARVPGAWVSRGSGQEHLTAIRSGVLTGAGACGEFLLLENGVPIRPAGFCNVNNLFELNIEQASELEVLRGPAGALYGGNAVHGVVNVRQTAREPGFRLALEGGPYDYYQVRAEGAVRQGMQTLDARFNSTSTNGYRDDTGFGQQKFSLLHGARLGAWQIDTLLSATLLNQETGGFVRGFEAYQDDDLRRTNPNPEAYRDAWSLRLSTRAERELADSRRLGITPYVRRSGMTFLQHFLPGQPLEENDQTSGGVMIDLSGARAALDWSVGLHTEFMSGSLLQDQAGPTVGSAFLVATRPTGLHYDYDVDSFMAAAFADAGYALTDAVRLVGSLRVEFLNYDYTNNASTGNLREDGTACGFGGCLYTRPASREDDYTNVAGRLGVEVQVDDDTLAYASVATGFRPPQATELYRLQNGQSLADIDSERLWQFEAGIRHRDVHLAVYTDRTRDLIFRDADGFNVSDGKTRSFGIELDWRWQFLPRNSLATTLAFGRHKYDFSGTFGREPIEDGDTVDTAPRWLGSVRWIYAHDRLRSELEVTGIDEHFINAANTARYDGHVVVHWRGDYRVSERLRVFARVLNVLDEEYADRADFAFGSYRYFPALPRQLYLGVEWRG